MTYTKPLSSFFAVAAVTALAVPALAQEPVQWRVEDGGSGHWYAVWNDGDVWSAAKATCEARGGHLVTITSAAENAFAWALLQASPYDPCFAMLSGYQDRQSSAYSEPSGGWRWVTDEPFTYSAWFSIEPNNQGGMEDYLEFRPFDCNARWNDGGTNSNPDPYLTYIVEWSADCNSDGIVDLGQIRDGTFTDLNDNGVPDCCEPGSCVPCAADIVRDLQVDGVDLAAVLGQWGTAGSPIFSADLNGSGLVDGADLAAVLSAWGPCPD
jgi:hypothetical protein